MFAKIKGIFKSDKDKKEGDKKTDTEAGSKKGSVKQCDGDSHGEPSFKCSSNKCDNDICRICAKRTKIEGNDAYVCLNCLISIQMLGGDDDDGMAFGDDDDDKEAMGFSGGGMTQTAKVTIDRDSGQISGWDSIWQLIAEENNQKTNVEDKTQDRLKERLQKGVNRYVADNKSAAASTTANEDESDASSTVDAYIFNFADFDIEDGKDEYSYVMVNKKYPDGSKNITITVDTSDPRNVKWLGMPHQLAAHMNVFTQKEQAEFPGTCLRVIIKKTFNPQ